MASAGLGAAYRHLRELFGAGSVVGLEDGQLLARYESERDETAFEALVGRHGPMVLTICRAVLRNEHDVEDAFQATFLVLARKAGSIRGTDALGGWLHRVAYRASVNASVEAARRRRKEAEASAMAHATASRLDPDLAATLHEEIDRLSESHRLPVVLCDLEGLTYEQAARQLRWTVPTLRNRLARGRQKLKARLTRRGLMVPAIGAILASNAQAAVPPSLLRMTVAAATGGTASAGAALLTHNLLRGMLMTKLKIASTTALAALALASAGYYAAGAGQPDEPKPAMKPAGQTQASAPEPKALKTASKPVEMVEIKGRVMSPDGKPFAGALVRGSYIGRETNRFPSATAGPDGRFTIRLSKPKYVGGIQSSYQDRFPWLVASAPGFGLGWAEWVLRADRPAEQVVTLTEVGTPIEGRIVDLEGRPVADAKVKVNRVFFHEKGDLSGWIARARNGIARNVWQGLEYLPLDQALAIEAKAGPDGRFKLDGIGRDRIADLLVSGPGVATTQVYAFCRDEPEIRENSRDMMRRPQSFNVHPPKFQQALAPSKRVEGVARDQDSGRPIAGLVLKAAVVDERLEAQIEGIEARTDAEGRYRLDGLPKAEAYRLYFSPGPGLPYTKGTLNVPADSHGLEPVAFDFQLKRGVTIRGTVTDKRTGLPVRGYAHYYAFADNPNVDRYPGFRRSNNTEAYINQEDGSFELVALPGKGLIAVRADEERHRGAIGDPKIPGYDAKMNGYHTLNFCMLANYHIAAAVDFDPKSEPGRLELQADPGKSVAVEVVDPDGLPIGGTKVKGLSDLFQSHDYPRESAGFEIHALDPTKPRRIVVIHEARKLIGSALLKGDEAGPVIIRLAPWGTVSGRIVDNEGHPRKAMIIGSPTGNEREHPETDDIIPGGDQANGIAVGNDGLFRVERLVPGLRYSANAYSHNAPSALETFGDLFMNLTVARGEVKDLGDIKVEPIKP